MAYTFLKGQEEGRGEGGEERGGGNGGRGGWVGVGEEICNQDYMWLTKPKTFTLCPFTKKNLPAPDLQFYIYFCVPVAR